MDDFELELKSEFLNEAEDLLNKAEAAFLRLETERNNPELMNEIFRLAHNLKGTSKAVGFDLLSELTHSAENLILKLKDGEIKVSDHIVSILLEFKDEVNSIIATLKSDINANFNIEEIKNKLISCVDGSSERTEVTTDDISMDQQPEEVLTAPEQGEWENISPSNESIDKNIESQNIEFQPDAFKENNHSELDFNSKIEVTENKEIKKTNVKKEAPTKTNSEDDSIRVNISKIDKLNNVVGELVILQTVLNQRRFINIKDELSNKSISQMAKLFKEAQELTMSLRMLPLKGTFQKMTRIVRDTSKALNKKINLATIGEETEVDKTVLELLSDPLVHIIRNAADHGIEEANDRINAKKPEEGTVTLKAYHEGSNLVINISDDGKGIDPVKITEKAQKKGLIPQTKELSQTEANNMIFHAGFSTKDQVTEVSGRGVGMDVVKTNIEQLGGEIQITSSPGKGSSFKIVLPLTLAIIDGIIVSSEKNRFVIPLSQVFELIKFKKADYEEISSAVKVFKLRGEVLPIFYLKEKFGGSCQPNDSQIIIVVRGLQYPFGIIVDDVLNQQQIVIKKLGEDIRGRKGLIGSAIMGDGRPSFIIDLFEMFKDELKENKTHQKLYNNIPA